MNVLAETLNRFTPPSEGIEMRERIPQPELPPNPTIHLVNAAVFFRRESELRRTPVTLENMDDEIIDKLTIGGKADVVYFMGLWGRSRAGKDDASEKYAFEYRGALPDLQPEKDIIGSGFSVPQYEPNPQVANGLEGLGRGISKLNERGVLGIVDLIPGHTSTDSPDLQEHPSWYIQGSEDLGRRAPGHFFRMRTGSGSDLWIAHNKEATETPLPWNDTAARNFANPEMQEALINEFLRVMRHVDGARFDMADLQIPETFYESWEWALSDRDKDAIKRPENNFWYKAISRIKAQGRELGREPFLMAESYVNQQRLRDVGMDHVYEHDYYRNLELALDGKLAMHDLVNHIRYLTMDPNRDWAVKYIGNHDEQPPFTKFGREHSLAAAAMTAFIPGGLYMVDGDTMRGQWVKTPAQVNRVSDELRDPSIAKVHETLLGLRKAPLLTHGKADVLQAWNVDPHQESTIIGQRFEFPDLGGVMLCTNWSTRPAYARVPIPLGTTVEVIDVINNEKIPDEKIDTPNNQGFFVGLPPGGAQLIGYSRT